jgi:acyl-CoA reductase-like NAD-dependent aldehyde dehydrogenase
MYPTHMFWKYIEAFYDAGMTTGCSANPLKFCPLAAVMRGEMAVFLERAMGNFNATPNPSGMLYGNQASLFTTSGNAARKFRYEADAGNIGINIGVAAPMAFFPFRGWKDSFFGDLHGQGMDAIDFFTQKKVVVERWPKEWSRKF